MQSRILVICIFILASIHSKANNLAISNVALSGDQLSFDVVWDNSWRVGLEHHDAVWIFIKQAPNGGTAWQHCNISTSTAGSGFETVLPVDHVGIFLRRSANGSGNSSTSVQVTLENQIGIFQDIKVFGVEMVYVPQGTFFAGDGVSNARIHRGDDDTESVKITSESSLTCGTTSTDIDFNSTCYNLNAGFPKGYNPFYSMKYTITQGQYVDFLNCLPRDQQENRVETAINAATTTLTNYYVMTDQTMPHQGNVIRCDANIGLGNITFYCDRDADGVPNEADDAISRAMNYMCPDDWAAYLDWSGLRPMTFLEFEKASRGPLTPIPNEYSWGSSLRNTPTAIANEGTINEDWLESGSVGGLTTYPSSVIRVGCNALGIGATRELSNASYYGIMDLGNNPGDYYLKAEHGGSFLANHGDGALTLTGESNVSTWPSISCIAAPSKLAGAASSVSAMGTNVTSRNALSGGRGIRSL